MPGVYLAALMFSLAGLAHIDNRKRLVFYAVGTPRFKVEWRQVSVSAIAIAVFLVWDYLGIANHIFFEGNGGWLVGVNLAPQLPIEEPLFLALLVYCAQLSLAASQRWLSQVRCR